MADRPGGASQETIKVALVGCGSRGTGAITQVLRTKGPVILWAMADLFGDRIGTSLASLVKGQAADYDREAYAGFGARIQVPPERRFVGFDAYARAIESGVDLVVLATPPHFRPLHFAHAVRQGKHLFMEKPLAVDAPGVRRVLATNQEAKAKGLKVGVGLMSRHNRCYQQTVQRIQDGALGGLMLLRCYWNTGFLRDTPARPPEMTEMTYQLRNPYHFLWLGGDYFVDALLHNLDVAFWIKGEYPVRAQGQGGRQRLVANQHGDTFDHHAVEYTFADGTPLFAQTRQISGCWGSSAVHVHGTQGVAEVGQGRIRGAKAWRFHETISNPYQVELDVLVEAIRHNRTHNEADHAARSTMAAILGRMAGYCGRLVTWDEAFQSELTLAPERYDFDAPPPVVAGSDGHYPVAIPGVTKAY